MSTWQKVEDGLAAVLLAAGLAGGWFLLAALEGRQEICRSLETQAAAFGDVTPCE
jgi:hypothetical protein